MPAYNAHATIRQAVASVAMQDDLDNILLTIVDDCSDKPYNYLIDDFRYMKIEVLRKPTNTGCGQSRQYGIDRCKCKYFMFLDADDCLYSPDAVKKIHSYMENEHLDFLYSDFLEELNTGDYFLHQNNGTWMHGKIFRTNYIRKKNIRFNETRIHEDHAFNIIVHSSGGKNLYIDYTTYVWKINPQSLTRSPHSFDYAMNNYIKNAEYTISELIKRNIKNEKIDLILKKYILSFYKYYNIGLSHNISNSEIEKFLYNISHFLVNIPSDILLKLSKEFLLEDFYEDYSIQEMIDNNVIFNISFNEYYVRFINPYIPICNYQKQEHFV